MSANVHGWVWDLGGPREPVVTIIERQAIGIRATCMLRVPWAEEEDTRVHSVAEVELVARDDIGGGLGD